MAYQSSVQATTQHTPADLLFGYQMRIPIEGRYPIPIDKIEDEEADRRQQLRELQPEQIKAAALIEEKQKQVKEKMEASKDLANPYQASDLMLLYAPAHKQKLEQANEGPFRIKKVGPRRTYVLETMRGVEYLKVSGRRLVPYKVKDRNEARVIVGELSHPLD